MNADDMYRTMSAMPLFEAEFEVTAVIAADDYRFGDIRQGARVFMDLDGIDERGGRLRTASGTEVKIAPEELRFVGYRQAKGHVLVMAETAETQGSHCGQDAHAHEDALAGNDSGDARRRDGMRMAA